MHDNVSYQIRNILIFFAVVLFLVICKVTNTLSVNIMLALFIAMLFQPLMNSMERAGIYKAVSTLIVVIMIFVVMFVCLGFVFYTVDQLAAKLPSYSKRIRDVDNLITSFVSRWVDIPDGYSFISGLDIDWISVVVMPFVRKISSSAVDIVKNAFFSILMAVFLLLERHSVTFKMVAILKDGNKKRYVEIVERINDHISKYLLIKLIISLATGVLFFFFTSIAGLDFAMLFGVLAFVLNFIPTIGSIVISLLTIIMAVLQFLPNWTPIMIVSVGIISTEMILGNILDPWLQGNNLNLSPFVILISLSIFGYVWGIVGMFFAVPLLSILQIVFANIESTKPLAVLLSSGGSLKKVIRKEERQIFRHQK